MFDFQKLMDLGQNKGKFTGQNNQKIKNFQIGFDTWIPLIFVIKNKPWFNFKMMELKALSFYTFWGPSFSDDAKLDKITQFTWLIN